MNYTFISAGTTIKNVPNNTIYLDVGNNLSYGIIDHHHLSTQKSATTLVYENKHLIPEYINTITLHKSPDLDCVAASFLVKYYHDNGEFPDFARQLCDFLDIVDFGYPTKHIVNLKSLFTIIKSKEEDDCNIIQKGHDLIYTLSKTGFDSGIEIDKYTNEIQDIKNDIQIFEKDIQQSKSKIFTIKDRYTQKDIQEKGLILFNPQSKLFKDWARDRGYDLLIVVLNSKRTVISLKGDSLLTLEGIANKLNKEEEKKRIEFNISIDEENRPGYDIPDPWYDGRAHNYTIIDSPRSGTLLNFDQIINIF
jgi:uncharacterized protein YqgV (UPF0045/DUF77 family)